MPGGLNPVTLVTLQQALEGQTDLYGTQLEIDFDRMMQDGQDNQDKFDTATGNGSKKARRVENNGRMCVSGIRACFTPVCGRSTRPIVFPTTRF